jgi:hypothetical protein
MRAIKHNRFVDDPYTTKGRYIHREGPGAFTAYQDGWSQSSKTYRTYSAAAERLFPERGAGGYSLSYYPMEDGYHFGHIELCGACALDEWLANPKQKFWVEHGDNDRRYYGAVTCDGCNKVIDPHLCAECGDEINEGNTGTFNDARLEPFHESGGVMLHAKCLAGLVVKGEAKKTGFQSYVKTGGGFSGEYRVNS